MQARILAYLLVIAASAAITPAYAADPSTPNHFKKWFQCSFNKYHDLYMAVFSGQDADKKSKLGMDGSFTDVQYRPPTGIGGGPGIGNYGVPSYINPNPPPQPKINLPDYAKKAVKAVDRNNIADFEKCVELGYQVADEKGDTIMGLKMLIIRQALLDKVAQISGQMQQEAGVAPNPPPIAANPYYNPYLHPYGSGLPQMPVLPMTPPPLYPYPQIPNPYPQLPEPPPQASQ